MIKALLLSLEPGATWDELILKKRGFAFEFLLFMLPVLVLATGAQVAGALHYGVREEVSGEFKAISGYRLAVYAAGEFTLSLVIILVGTRVLRGFGDTFHSRHTFHQCFTVVAYSLSPVFLVRLLEAFPWMNPWASLAIGLALSWRVLYQGIPRVLQPDPPHAFGLYLSSAVTLCVLVVVARFISLLILEGKIAALR